MTLGAVIRDAVGLAKDIAGDGALLVEITLEQWTGQSGGGPTRTYDSSTLTLKALVDYNPKPIRTVQGEEITPKAMVYIYEPVPDGSASGRNGPIDPRDRITLPNGLQGAPIHPAPGLVDPKTSRPYMHAVALG